MERHTGSGRALALAAAAICLWVTGCDQPRVGEHVEAAAPSEGPRIVIVDATVELHGHVLVTFEVTQDDVPLTLAQVTALAPRFTLATLGAHPVDGIRAWRSQVLTGGQIAEQLPPSGPGTPPALVVQGARQPGSETPASLLDLGGGRFRYRFTSALSGFDPDDTVRVGAWLRGATQASLRTATTLDFRPSGGPMEERDTVLDERCNGCHGNLVAHDGRAGVRLCLTCHTWQNSDPDTIDPAAMGTAVTTRTDPNPLELGRLVHRIHRGRRLPTLFASRSRANPAPALAAQNVLPLPFSPENSTSAIFGRKYSVLGFRSIPFVPGQVVQRATNGQAPKTLATGVSFPRDLRDCGACHAGARQSYMVKTAISRRTCAGCHPDVWFQGTPATLDEVHFAHPGGPQDDDAECAKCHLEAPSGSRLYAPIEELHVPIPQGSRYNALGIQIVKVDRLKAGERPVVTFRVWDRYGPLVPALNAPASVVDPDPATSGFVPRALASLAINVTGATSPDYGPAPTALLSSGVRGGNLDPLAASTAGAAAGEWVYTFTSVVPQGATGTWAVGMEARRRLKYGHYDPASDVFRWPGTGETVTESPENPVVYVDTATGAYTASGSRASPGATPRRKVIAEQNCLRCHGRFELHGSQRHQVEYCVMCHTPTRTDWSGRKKTPTGVVDLAQTLDGIEERSLHFKVMVHRIHTGERTGSASLEALEPFVMANAYFDEVRFPNDLANCTVCHVGETFHVENVPANAPPTVANETGSVRHAPGSAGHVSGEPARPPIQAACTGCHATGATFAHVASKTAGGVETCPSCHARGPLAVAVVHGLEPLTGTAASSSFSSIAQTILTPRCATTACHARGGTPPVLEGAGAYAALVGAPSGQSSLRLVEAGAPDRSYLVYKVRGTAGSVGGIGTLMPTDGALAPADVSAIEAWISNGAPND